MNIYTIGFTKTSAENFFNRLIDSGATKLIDIRLNNKSQLAGFAKGRDLEYFLRAICNMNYEYVPMLAPTQDILDEYKKNKGDWKVYEEKFIKLMAERVIENQFKPSDLKNTCLLCSEDTADNCHRRLVVEYLARYWNDVNIVHL